MTITRSQSDVSLVYVFGTPRNLGNNKSFTNSHPHKETWYTSQFADMRTLDQLRLMSKYDDLCF